MQFPFTLERLPIYFVAPLIPFFLAGMALSMIFDLRPRGDRIALLRGPRRRVARRAGRDVPAAGGRRRIGRADRGDRCRFVAAACLARSGAASSALSARDRAGAGRGHERVARAVPRDPRRVQGDAPADGRHAGHAVAQTGWNAYSRIDAVEGFEDPYLARLYIDSDAWTSILKWDGNLASVGDMSTWYRALPFRMFDKPETLIIGPGGGSDVLVALAAGSRKVTAVELNPLMLQFVRHYGAARRQSLRSAATST